MWRSGGGTSDKQLLKDRKTKSNMVGLMGNAKIHPIIDQKSVYWRCEMTNDVSEEKAKVRFVNLIKYVLPILSFFLFS